jgi:hypothetical protein
MGDVHVVQNESQEWHMIHALLVAWYREECREVLQKMREEFYAENEGIPIPTQVR